MIINNHLWCWMMLWTHQNPKKTKFLLLPPAHSSAIKLNVLHMQNWAEVSSRSQSGSRQQWDDQRDEHFTSATGWASDTGSLAGVDWTRGSSVLSVSPTDWVTKGSESTDTLSVCSLHSSVRPSFPSTCLFCSASGFTLWSLSVWHGRSAIGELSSVLEQTGGSGPSKGRAWGSFAHSGCVVREEVRCFGPCCRDSR